jgi:hypothetical protein
MPVFKSNQIKLRQRPGTAGVACGGHESMQLAIIPVLIKPCIIHTAFLMCIKEETS